MVEEQKVAVITGSSRGIGKGIAEQLGKDGYAMVINGYHKDETDKTTKELADKGFKVVSAPGDVSKKSTHEMLVKTAVDNFGRLDTYINNAGIAQLATYLTNLQKTSIRSMQQMLTVFSLAFKQLPNNLRSKMMAIKFVRLSTPQVLLDISVMNNSVPTLQLSLLSVV